MHSRFFIHLAEQILLFIIIVVIVPNGNFFCVSIRIYHIYISVSAFAMNKFVATKNYTLISLADISIYKLKYLLSFNVLFSFQVFCSLFFFNFITNCSHFLFFRCFFSIFILPRFDLFHDNGNRFSVLFFAFF